MSCRCPAFCLKNFDLSQFQHLQFSLEIMDREKANLNSKHGNVLTSDSSRESDLQRVEFCPGGHNWLLFHVQGLFAG